MRHPRRRINDPAIWVDTDVRPLRRPQGMPVGRATAYIEYRPARSPSSGLQRDRPDSLIETMSPEQRRLDFEMRGCDTTLETTSRKGMAKTTVR